LAAQCAVNCSRERDAQCARCDYDVGAEFIESFQSLFRTRRTAALCVKFIQRTVPFG
jgi:hypothetical protein